MSEEIKKEIERNELNEQELSNVSGGTCTVYDGDAGPGEYDVRFKLEKCPAFQASGYVNSILNNRFASDTAKDAIRADLGRCSKCQNSKNCTFSNEDKIKYGGLSFWNGKL